MNVDWLLLAVFVIGVTALVGFFATKTRGFGRFATSAFLLLLVVIISALCCAGDKLDAGVFSNLLFGVVGFAGGLFSRKERNTHDTPPKQ